MQDERHELLPEELENEAAVELPEREEMSIMRPPIEIAPIPPIPVDGSESPVPR